MNVQQTNVDPSRLNVACYIISTWAKSMRVDPKPAIDDLMRGWQLSSARVVPLVRCHWEDQSSTMDWPFTGRPNLLDYGCWHLANYVARQEMDWFAAATIMDVVTGRRVPLPALQRSLDQAILARRRQAMFAAQGHS